ALGYTFEGLVGGAREHELSLAATAQALMLLAHASVTAGMKLAGTRYERPTHVIASVPPYSLVVLSFICLSLGYVLVPVRSLQNLAHKANEIASTAVLVEIGLAVRRRNPNNIAVSFSVLLLNFVSQTLSGWKGLTL